jgi:DNA-directed RNA polymerase specialized sigma24 family protein
MTGTNTEILPDRATDDPIQKVDWFCRHLHRDQEYLALARRLSGSIESAQEVYELAMRRVLDEGNWCRIINPHAYMMRLIFDIAVARLENALLPAAQYISDREVGPLPIYGRSPGEAVAALTAIRQMRPANRKFLWAWQVERRSFRDMARKFHIKPDAVSGHAAKAIKEFHECLTAAFCDPARVCQRTDGFFGTAIMQRPARRYGPWWRVPPATLLPLLIGVNIGAWTAAGSTAIALNIAEIGGWFQ